MKKQLIQRVRRFKAARSTHIKCTSIDMPGQIQEMKKKTAISNSQTKTDKAKPSQDLAHFTKKVSKREN